MASAGNASMKDGIMAYRSETTGVGDNQNMQMDTRDVERDDLAIIREKRLNMMSKCSILTALVSLIASVVGILAILYSGGKFPYSLGGSAIAGVMALSMTICPFCMYMEGKKTKTGTKMSGLFNCCTISLVIWFCFCLCGILVAMGMSGIWGMIECIQEIQSPGQWSTNSCSQKTNENLTFSVLTLILSAFLLILTIVIVCLFCCNTEAFGIKNERQREFDYYRNVIRAEVQRELVEQRTHERPRPDIPYDDRVNNPNLNRTIDDHGHVSRYVDRRDKNEEAFRLENQNEEPPPSYEEIVNKNV